jgi:FeS assembly SUF system protein
MVSKEEILEKLTGVYDPEIPINIVDLGLIYDINIQDGKVHIKMTLTAPGCPVYSLIEEMVKQALRELEGVDDVQVEFVWDPPWTPDRMSPKAKAMLGLI